MTRSALGARARVGLAVGGIAMLCACHGRTAGSVPSPTDARALLLDPTNAYWAEPAPTRYEVVIETTKGELTIAVDRALSPLGADRFYRLVRAGYFDDSRFFRVVPGFIAQFGIAGQPAIAQVWKDRAFADDSVRTSNVRGTIAFAMTGPNTRTTQLFISLVDNTRLDVQGFSPLGRVVRGMDVVDRIYGGYGENAGGGVRAGKQGRLMNEGNVHLDKDFPQLDKLVRAYVR